jgi:hypothetical protein
VELSLGGNSTLVSEVGAFEIDIAAPPCLE